MTLDLFPSLNGFLDLPIPRNIEGYDFSDARLGRSGTFEQEAVLTMNFGVTHNY
jgi:hypothetical protein